MCSADGPSYNLTHLDLINTAEQCFGWLILLWGASCLNRLQESLWRQSHHPVQQTQQERYNQLEQTQRYE